MKKDEASSAPSKPRPRVEYYLQGIGASDTSSSVANKRLLCWEQRNAAFPKSQVAPTWVLADTVLVEVCSIDRSKIIEQSDAQRRHRLNDQLLKVRPAKYGPALFI